MQRFLGFLARHAPFVAALGALVVFAPTLGHDFLAWDDRVHTVENARLLDTAYFWTNADQGLYMPITFSLWSVAGRLFGANPAAFHALNVTLHAASAALCWKLLLLLKGDDDQGSRLAALAGALLFAWHPLQAESVSWITSLKDVGCGFFSLWALVLFVWPTNDDAQARRVRFLSMGALFCASLCKPAAVGVVLMLLAIDVLWRHQTLKQALKSALPFALVLLPSLLVNVRSQGRLTLLYETPFLYRPLIALDSLGFYVKKVVAPWEILPAYERSPRFLIESGRIWFTWLLGAAALGGVLLARRASPRLFQSGALFLAGTALVLGLKPFAAQDNSTVYDHYVYLALIGPAWGLAALVSKSRPALLAAFAMLLVFAGKSAVQSRAWKTDETLWSFTIARNDDTPVALVNLAAIRSEQGRVSEAMGMLQHAIYVKPHDPQAHNNLGALLAKQGKLEEAGPHFARAVQLDPKNQGALGNFARYQLTSGDVGGAERTLRRLLAHAPGHREGNLTLGEILVNTGRADECRAILTSLLPALSNDHEALTLLGVAEAQTNDLGSAIRHFERALSLDPGYEMARRNLRTALAASGKVP